MSNTNVLMPVGQIAPRRDGPRPSRLVLAFVVSVGLHALLIANTTWQSASMDQGGALQFIEARIVTASPPDPTAAAVSRPPPTEAPAPARPVESPAQVTRTEPVPRQAPVLAAQTPGPAPQVQAEVPPATVSVPQPVEAQGREGGTATAQAATRPVEQQFDLSPEPDYHPAGLLDPPPVVLQTGELVDPPNLRRVDGTVVLRLLINAKGQLDAATIARSNPPGVFDLYVLSAFASAKFKPGYLAGVPVKSQMILEVQYTRTNRGTAVSGSTFR